jgi:hypothetical protein
MNQQLKSWLSYKFEKEEYATKGMGITPGRTEHDLIFVVYQNTKMPNPNMIYDDLA